MGLMNKEGKAAFYRKGTLQLKSFSQEILEPLLLAFIKTLLFN